MNKIVKFARTSPAKALVLVSALGAAASANAAATLDPAVATAFTAITDNATAMFGLAMPVVATVTGMFIVIALFKKFSRKAA